MLAVALLAGLTLPVAAASTVPASDFTPVQPDCAPDNGYESMAVQSDGTLFFPNDGCAASLDLAPIGVPNDANVTVVGLSYKVTGHVGTICGYFGISGRAVGQSALACNDSSTPFVHAEATTSPGDAQAPLTLTWHATTWEHDNAYLCSVDIDSEPAANTTADSCGFAATDQRCMPGLTATALADGSVRLDWPAVMAEGTTITAYQVVERPVLPEMGDWTPLSPQATAGSQSYTVRGLVTGSTYEFAVVALKGPSDPYGTFCHAFATTGAGAQVPLFPGGLATGLAFAGTAAAAVLVGRRMARRGD